MRARTKWLGVLLLTVLFLSQVQPATWADSAHSELSSWLEPRGISVVDLVGQVPEATLKSLIVAYGGDTGILVYESGSRQGNTTTITTKIYPRLIRQAWAPNGIFSQFGCLGHRPVYDHPGTVVPASTLRIYDGDGRDITWKIEFMYVTNMGARKPLAGTTEYDRYSPWYDYGPWRTYPLPMGPAGLEIPTNSGCKLQIPGEDHRVLTGVFTLSNPWPAQVSILGSQSATFNSYIGPGAVGIFAPLMSQLQARYGNRHSRIPLSIPAGAKAFLLKFPPMSGDPYADQHFGPPYINADRSAAGTYRLGTGTALSYDMTSSAVLPLAVTWQDADQASGSVFLPKLMSPTELEAPEYILPAGIAYNVCFTQGNCPQSVLDEIYRKTMSLEITYLYVQSPPVDLQWTSLRMAGPAWQPDLPDSAATNVPETNLDAPGHVPSDTPPDAYFQFLPIVIRDPLNPCPEHPCGAFDWQGRMLDYVP